MKYAVALAAALALTGLSAQAATKTYTTLLSGAAESPATPSFGGGAGIVTIDDVAMWMHVQTTFAGLSGNVTASHIHCCTAPGTNAAVATQTPTFIGFPSGVKFGSYDHTFDMTLAASFRAGFITANGGTAATAFAALVSGLDAGMAYLNIHTNLYPGGEIRGFLVPVPEPSTYALMALGLAGVGFAARRRA